MSSRNFTYQTLADDFIQLDWKIYGRTLPSDGVIKTWKKNADLEVQLGIFLDANQLNKCIAEGAKASFYLSYHSLKKLDGTGLQNGIKLFDYEQTEGAFDKEFSCVIPGEMLAGSVELCFSIALSLGSKLQKSVCATEEGSVLYENKILIHLEGNQALFPVKAIDFSKMEHPRPQALYYLNRKFRQLDSNFNSSYTLYFNSTHPLFKKINMDSQNESSNQYLLKMIMYDVYRTIVFDALDENHGLNELENPETEEDSFSLQSVYSRIVSDLIRIYFPEKDLSGLKKMTKDEDTRNKILTAVQDYILGE